MRFGLFIHCRHIDAFFPEVGVATLKFLERFQATRRHYRARVD
jgi:hypothetical protein